MSAGAINRPVMTGLTKLSADVTMPSLDAYAGHRQLQNLKRYIQLSPGRSKGFRWND